MFLIILIKIKKLGQV